MQDLNNILALKFKLGKYNISIYTINDQVIFYSIFKVYFIYYI